MGVRVGTVRLKATRYSPITGLFQRKERISVASVLDKPSPYEPEQNPSSIQQKRNGKIRLHSTSDSGSKSHLFKAAY